MNLTFWVWGRVGLAVGASILLASATAPNPKTFESFGDWCTNKEHLTPQARHTVEVLLSKAKTQECDRAQATLTNLTELSLIRDRIVDIQPLSKLTNLKKLNLSSNQITDVQPLSGLTNLRFLVLNFNQISDVKPLSGLTNLTELFLEANQIVDATPLAGLTNLTGFSLASNQLVDVAPLSKMAKLEFLYLSGNKIVDVEPLSALTNLILLFIHSNQIVDVKPLGGLTNLTALDLSSNQIQDVTALEGLTKLTNLELGGNKIPDGEADRLLQKNKQILNQKTDAADRLLQEAQQLFDRQTAVSYREALQKFDAARSLYQTLGDRKNEAYILNQMGMIANRLGERQQALDYYKQALSGNQILGDRPKQAIILNNLGAVYYALGEKQQALDYYNQVLALIREMSDRPIEALNLNNLLQIPPNSDTSLDDRPKQAIPLSNILNISPNTRTSSGDRTVEATTLNNIGLAYNDLGDKQKAREYFDRALTLFRAMGDRPKEATALTNIGLVYNDLGNQQQALGYYKQALHLRRKVGDRRGEALTLNNIGVVYSELGEKQKAQEYFNQSLPLFRAVGDRPGEALTLYNIANIKGNFGNLIPALTDIEASIKIVENLRTKISSHELRTSYFVTVNNYYQFYIQLLMALHKTNPKSGYDTKALEASERSRARTLLELLQEANADIRQGVAPELLQQERNLQQQLDTLETQSIENYTSQSPNYPKIAELEKQRQNLLSQYQEIQAKIRTTSPRYAALTQPQPLTLSQIQQQILDDNTILLQYSLGEKQSYLWAVSKTSITSYELPPRAEIETAARNFRHAVTHPLYRDISNRVTKASNALSKIILQPVAAQLAQKRLLIVGDGILNYLPFAALSLPETSGENDHKPLIVDREIVLLPSASTLGILRQNYRDRPSPTRTLAMFADPVFSAQDERFKAPATNTDREAIESVNLGLSRSSRDNNRQWSRLKFTRKEAEIIQSLVSEKSSTQSLDFSANRATATSSNLSQYKIIHFATHGFANSTHPELSGILMSLVDTKGKPLNGFLRLTDIFNLKLAAELVVLSACQTGLGQNIQGEGMVGLTRGFMYAGAKRVVVSLWNVDDEGTSKLMASFYEGMLKKGLTPVAALRAAQLEMLQQKQWQSPYYWAAFTLQGEWR
ncbi:MAG: CHAT domain-containing protein [Microcoleus sp. PH2017_10_PVI_O_A]|uniref:CHAT domain-containing protein n=1 Tax=unclassified Microcoleus TaxID=2642155 RepID=UPI001DB6E099|nr:MULTISPECIES: CHAT domain-containing protein [unclassified Microcoleus]TAE77498.1 MAG: CHAT domain-containing protein [Oscillatoriales cyanobacterium]MCC3406054.1 CHAT domain-containing protein [Microcoleus sp. PH2017_10_PVI_O_A]MCC3460199.1 CHAT domain-containing protein [Microcoleus sp. PH2017_11_PCY_U_A]MCC3478622.1 CHAT domain-containing protein [Microcoleus sp. PH2017_12_PCY_D_A]MCC3559506.1 CHAT domain-containing protein [Microcoleus sp. PH2017_27_LUM_O_A]